MLPCFVEQCLKSSANTKERDGKPRRFLEFLASFKTNIARKLTDYDEDAALKLTRIIPHCIGNAKTLIDDCVMLGLRQGFAIEMERCGMTKDT